MLTGQFPFYMIVLVVVIWIVNYDGQYCCCPENKASVYAYNDNVTHCYLFNVITSSIFEHASYDIVYQSTKHELFLETYFL